MWNIILTLTVCLVLALLVDGSLLMIGYKTINSMSKNDIDNFITAAFVLVYVILISLVFGNIIGLGKLSLIIIVVYAIIYVLHSNKDKLFD